MSYPGDKSTQLVAVISFVGDIEHPALFLDIIEPLAEPMNRRQTGSPLITEEVGMEIRPPWLAGAVGNRSSTETAQWQRPRAVIVIRSRKFH